MPKPRESQPEAEPRGRSQLIESAIRIVATRGRKGATVRAIAEDASVTAGLIKHHFSSKDRLLEEADETVASRFIDAMTPPVASLSPEETIDAIAGHLYALIGVEPELRIYVRRGLLEATPSGATIFNKLVEVTVEQIHNHLPGRAPADDSLLWTAT
ncbi:MAG: TetR family transcriptional regulator, partial [Halioglobus sp.]|nr:TetR family transcriptional regulator [Halioglobus sp.]